MTMPSDWMMSFSTSITFKSLVIVLVTKHLIQCKVTVRSEVIHDNVKVIETDNKIIYIQLIIIDKYCNPYEHDKKKDLST